MSNKSLDKFIHMKEQVEPLKKAEYRTSGVTIIAGTTGLGKSMSLNTALKFKHRDNLKISTVEELPEYKILKTG